MGAAIVAVSYFRKKKKEIVLVFMQVTCRLPFSSGKKKLFKFTAHHFLPFLVHNQVKFKSAKRSTLSLNFDNN